MLESKAECQNIYMTKRRKRQPASIVKRRSKLLSYKSVLLLHDIIVLILIATLCWFASPTGANLIFNSLVAAIILSSYMHFALYSYHLIFSIRCHFTAIAKALLFSLSTVIIVLSILFAPKEAVNTYLVPVTFTCAAIIIAANRKFDGNLMDLLFPIGISFITVGALEIWRSYWSLGINLDLAPVFLSLLASSACLTLSRVFIVHIVFNRILRKQFRRQVIIVGVNSGAKQFAQHVIALNAPFWILGSVSIGENKHCDLATVPDKACLGRLDELPELVDRHNISELVVTSSEISKRDLIAILDFCISSGINAWFSPELMPIIDIKMHIDSFCGKPMIRLCSQKRSWLFSKIKYASDALITLPTFILQIPLFLSMMIAVKIDSKGPVFYKAKAIGKGGQEFGMFKFRSMYVDADKSIHQEYVSKLITGEINKDQQQNGPLKIVNDPRVTRVGKFLRKWSLDELPQLLNVLRGEMSLVGPRPCLPYEYDIYQDWHKKRTVVRPGITGLWQVTGRSEVLFEDMILLDLYYIYNSSLMMDLQILFETVFVVLGKRGAY